jgi:hypothetical protein
MGLKIIGTIGCQFTICLTEKIPVLNRETGLFDQAKKRLFTGPKYQLYPVHAPGSKIVRYYVGEEELDAPDSQKPRYLNLKTGKPLTYKEAILALMQCESGKLETGQIAVSVTPETVQAVRDAIKEGFPIDRVNDAKGLLSIANLEPEPVEQKEIILDDIKIIDEDDVNGIADLKRLDTDTKEAAGGSVEDLLVKGIASGLVVKKGPFFSINGDNFGPGKAKAIAVISETPEVLALLKGGLVNV